MIDLAPAPGAAPRARRIIDHARMEASLMLRNGEQLLLAVAIPAGLLLAWRFFLPADLVGDAFPASVLALAVWSTGFTSLAISTAFELRYGVLERLAATPLRKADIILGKALSTASVAAVQVGVLALLAVGLGWRPGVWGEASMGWGWAAAGMLGLPVCLLAGALGLVTFAAWALTLASRLKAEVVLALANLIYLLAAAGGGIVVGNPSLWWLPTAALGDTLRGFSAGWTPLAPLSVLAGWALLSVLVARKAFRWIS